MADVGDEQLSEDGLNQHNQQNTVTTNLATSRARYAEELKNPIVRQHLFNSIKAEVGGQDNATKLKYLETIFNRAASRGQTIDATVTSAHRNGGYYPDTTINHLNDAKPPDFSGILDQALGGSNTSNFATGNESGDVHSEGAPVVSVGNKEERFVIENADTAWAKSRGSDMKSIVSSGKVPSQSGESQPTQPTQQATVKPYKPAEQTSAQAEEPVPLAKVDLPEPERKRKPTQTVSDDSLYSSGLTLADTGTADTGVPEEAHVAAAKGPATKAASEEETPSALADVLNQVWDQYG